MPNGILRGENIKILKSVVTQKGGAAMELRRRKTDAKGLKSVLYFEVDEKVYNRTKDLAETENYQNFLFLCRIGGIALSLLVLISFIPGLDEYLGRFRYVFAGFALVFLLMALIFRFYVKEHKKALLPLCYLMSALVLILAIVIGPVLDTETLSTTFFIFLFVIALLIVDLPIRLGILFVIASAIFCFVVIINKNGIMKVHDLINCAIFLPASLVIGTRVEKRKFEQFRLQRQIEGERDTDGLTTLLTRDAGQRTIERLLKNGAVKTASLVIMDLDNFKGINDTYGHPAGDVLLGMVGNILESSFRNTDVLVRFGGDEFVLFLPDISEGKDVKKCMEKIRTHLNNAGVIPGHEQTASFGVAFFPEHGETFEELFRRADKALYVAKYRGKDTSCIYHEKR